MSIDPLPPHNLEAEQSVLGSVLLDRDAIARVSQQLRGEDFYSAANGTIFDAMVALYRKRQPADLVTIANELTAMGRLEQVGGVAYLGTLLGIVPTSVHAGYYADIVDAMAAHRRLIAAGTALVAMGYDRAKDMAEAMHEARARLAEVYRERGQSRARTMDQAIGELALELELQWTGDWVEDFTPTGYYDLDNRLSGGMRDGDLVIVGGRPGMAKTAFGLCVTLNTSKRQFLLNEVPAWSYFFSSEMTLKAICYRALAETTGIPSRNLRSGRDAEGKPLTEAFKQTIRQQLAALAALPIVIDDTSQITTRLMRERVLRFANDHPLGFVVHDYLQLAGDDADRNPNETDRIGKISKALKDIARTTEVPVMALAQLSRNVESRRDKMPTLADLRQSGQIEQDADVVMLLYRQDYYEALGMLEPDQIKDDKRGTCEVNIAKQREGETGIETLQFVPEITAFRNLDRRTA
jgi:replicative DNA helicase